jgi:hypothetical protein
MYACMSRRCDAVGALPDFGNSWCRSLSCFLRVLCVRAKGAWTEKEGFRSGWESRDFVRFPVPIVFWIIILICSVIALCIVVLLPWLLRGRRYTYIHACTRTHHISMLALECTRFAHISCRGAFPFSAIKARRRQKRKGPTESSLTDSIPSDN